MAYGKQKHRYANI